MNNSLPFCLVESWERKPTDHHIKLFSEEWSTSLKVVPTIGSSRGGIELSIYFLTGIECAIISQSMRLGNEKGQSNHFLKKSFLQVASESLPFMLEEIEAAYKESLKQEGKLGQLISFKIQKKISGFENWRKKESVFLYSQKKRNGRIFVMVLVVIIFCTRHE